MTEPKRVKQWHSFIKVRRRVIFHAYCPTEEDARDMLVDMLRRLKLTGGYRAEVRPIRHLLPSAAQMALYEALFAAMPEPKPFPPRFTNPHCERRSA
jgi:hypothetical protein